MGEGGRWKSPPIFMSTHNKLEKLAAKYCLTPGETLSQQLESMNVKECAMWFGVRSQTVSEWIKKYNVKRNLETSKRGVRIANGRRYGISKQNDNGRC